MKKNITIGILQVLLASIGMIQLVEGAWIMALASVLVVYGVGAFGS